MLFDLEDYATSRIISSRGSSPLRTADQINWDDGPYTTFRATRDAYMQAIHQYYIAASVMSTPAERQQLDIDYLNLKDSLVDLDVKSRIFWPALISLPIKGDLQEGEKFNLQWVSIDDTTTGIDFWFPNEYYIPNWNNGVSGKYVAVSDVNGDYTYSTLTQAIYDDYKNALVTFQSKVKTLMLHGEGQSVFQEWVAPEVPAYALYPEITGYVRGTNSLSIKDAIVRIIDADGVAHEVITDDKGYYKFSNEYIYNNFALTAAGATNSFVDGSFNMFLLDHKNGSTVKLYDKTSKFENSFFGAENNRSMTWPVYVKMGRNNRRNFKIEFIPDYSNYPSFSGYVKDNDGNPIKDAYVQIKDGWSGFCIGQYMKPNGDIAMNFKYNDFGVDRTVLTDENGFYEYTPQMVGEWFNKQFMKIGDVNGKLGGKTFDEYFVNPIDINFDEYTTNRRLLSNETFLALLIPYKQDANDSSIKWEGVHIYDEQDYYASRFKYALNQYNDFQYQKIELSTHYDINVDVVVATNDEFRADKITIGLLTERKNLPVDQNHYFSFGTSTGYMKVVYPSTGESYVVNGSYNSGWHLNVIGNQDTYSNFYAYACDSEGRAMGYIRTIYLPTYTEYVDFSQTSYLGFINFDRFYGEDLDFTGLKYLRTLYINQAHMLREIAGLNSDKLVEFSLGFSPIETFNLSNCKALTNLNLTNLTALESLDISSNTELTNIEISSVDVVLDVTGLSKLNYIIYGKITMTSDDVDDLINQLGSSVASGGYLNIDRISRSSYSDTAYDKLMSQGWNINLGPRFYDELIVPKKLILTMDDSRSENEQMYLSNTQITTTTGYWIGKLWNGAIFGYAPYFVNYTNNASAEYYFGKHDGVVEFYSSDEYGVPMGEITEIYFSDSFKYGSIDTSQLSSLTHIAFNSGTGKIEHLDFGFNTALTNIYVFAAASLKSINVSGLTSLEVLYLSNCAKLDNVIGFSSLSSLRQLYIETLPNLPYLSLSGLTHINNVFINEIDLYDSTHVDTMLADLNVNVENFLSELIDLIALKQTERDVKLAELSAFDAQEPTISTLDAEKEAMYVELDQLISDGADQSLIDAKQLLIDAKGAEITAKKDNRKVIEDQLSALDSEILDLNNQVSETFSGANFSTNYMARTSASDADYDSLITYGWNLNIGSEFIAPYEAPVKGYITIGDLGSGSSSFNNHFRIASTTGVVKFISPEHGSSMFWVSNGNNQETTSISIDSGNGVVEFYSCDSHGRPSGSIIAFGKSYQTYMDSYIKSFDLSDLVDIENIYFETGVQGMTSLDLSSNVNIKYLTISIWYTIESIIGLEGLTGLRMLYINTAPVLDIPVDFTSMTNLERLTLQSVDGIQKNSRLNVSGLTRLNEVVASWTNILSVDLDNVLSVLDANGLNSDSDFNGFMGQYRFIQFGMGIGYHETAAVNYASLISKGWTISIGDQIIDSVEDPVIGTATWGMDAGWVALYFYTRSGMSTRFRYPDGNIGEGNMFSFSFDGSQTNRTIEFWAVDGYGRPRHEGIYQVHDWWNTHPTLLDIKNLSAVEVVNIPRHRIVELDFTGMANLYEVNASNSETLQTILFEGCSKMRLLELSGCPNIDIDQVLESLDASGAVEDTSIGSNAVYAFEAQRTHVSDLAADSLMDKGWSLNLIEPAGDTVILNVTANQYVLIDVATSAGAVKFTFPVGSEMHGFYPDGYILSGCYYRNFDDFQNQSLSFNPDFTGQVLIKSISNNDYSKDSGEVRYISMRDHGTFAVSNLSKLKFLKIGSESSFSWFQQNLVGIAGLQLSMLRLEQVYNYSGSMNLSTFSTKRLSIGSCNFSQITLGNTLIDVALESLGNLTNISSWPSSLETLYLSNLSISQMPNLPDSLKYFYINGLYQLSSFDLPNGLVDVNITWCSTLDSTLDFTNATNLRSLSLNYLNIPSVDITGLTKLESITFDSIYLQGETPGTFTDATSTSDIIGLETTSAKYIYLYHMRNPDFVIPTSTNQCTLQWISQDTETISIVTYGNEYIEANVNIYLYGTLANLTSLTLPKVRDLSWRSAGTTFFDASSITDSRTQLYISQCDYVSLDFTGIASGCSIVLEWLAQLTSITGLPSNMRDFNIDYSYAIRNIDFSGTTFSGTVHLFHLNGATNNPVNITGVNCSNLYLYYNSNINIVDSNIVNNMQMLWNYGNITMSNVNCTWRTRISYSYIKEFNTSNTNLYQLEVTNNYGYNNQNWSISFNNLTSYQIELYTNSNLTQFSATGSSSSIERYQLGWNTQLVDVTASLRNTTYFYSGNNLNNLTISDASLSASNFSYFGVFRNGGTYPSAFVDSYINAVSQTSANNGQLRGTSLNSRTSASTAGFNKLVSQGWSMMSV